MIGQFLLDQIETSLNKANIDEFDKAVKTLHQHQTIFVIGSGRSGLVGNFFGMRLMHLGKSAYIVGETNTPAIQKGDLLIAISGSGNTSSIVNAVKKAQEYGAEVLAITANPRSSIYQIADKIITIDSRNRSIRVEKPDIDKEVLRKTPMGTSFELGALLYLETIVSELMHVCNLSEIDMKQRHVNL